MRGPGLGWHSRRRPVAPGVRARGAARGLWASARLGACALWVAVALPAAAAAPPAAAAAPAAGDQAPTIGLDEIQRGQRGYGLTVFSGTTPERFDAEVLGVLRNLNPDSSFILARLSGRGLEDSGVIAGMSGSPVYFDGRLAGAVAFSWSFARDPIAGITPIAEMRRLEAIGAPGEAPQTGMKPVVSLPRLAALELPPDLLATAIGRLRPTLAAGAASALQWTAVGFGAASEGLLERSLGPVAMGGIAAGEATPPAGGLAPGDPVAAVLVDGDLRLAATGTVTAVTGDSVLAFGHSFLGFGPVAVPMAQAEVVTVVSNLDTSFKVTNVGPVVGAFDQDRRAGLRGRLGAAVPTIPVVVRVHGTGDREFHMRLADEAQVTPALLATCVLGGLEAASYRGGLQGIDLRASFVLADHGVLRLEQSFDGPNAGVEGASYVLALASYLLQNDLAQVQLDGVAIDLVQSASPRTATLVGAHAERTVVRPGEQVRLNVDLVAYRGAAFRRSLDVTLPDGLPAGRYSLLVGDGSSVDAARLAVESVEPVNFPQALRLLRSFHSRRELVVLGVFAGQGLTVAGQPMPRLPGSVRALWGTSPAGGAVPLRLAVAQEHSEQLEVPISGIVRVDLEVRRREPQKPGEEGEVEPDEGVVGPDEGSGGGGSEETRGIAVGAEAPGRPPAAGSGGGGEGR
jgi:SpoIVB peptidase S55